MAFNQLIDKETQKEFIRFIINEVRGSKYEEICKQLLRDFEKYNPLRIKKILENFQTQIMSFGIKTEPESIIPANQIEKTKEDNNVIVILSDDDEVTSQQLQKIDNKQNLVNTPSNHIESDNDTEILITSSKKNRKKRKISSDDSISDVDSQKSNNQKTQKLKRIITHCVSSSSSTLSSKVDSTSFYTATASNSLSENPLNYEKSYQNRTDSERTDSYANEKKIQKNTQQQRKARCQNQKLFKKNEIEKLQEATLKSFIGSDILKISSRRKTKVVDYNLDKESSDDSDDQRIQHNTSKTKKTRSRIFKRKKLDSSNSNVSIKSNESDAFRIVTHVPSAVKLVSSTEEEEESSSNDEHPILTLDNIMCKPLLERCDYSKIKGKIRVHQVNQKWEIIEDSQVNSFENQCIESKWDLEISDSEGLIDEPIPISRSHSSKIKSDIARDSISLSKTGHTSCENLIRPKKDMENKKLTNHYEVQLKNNGTEYNMKRNEQETTDKVSEYNKESSLTEIGSKTCSTENETTLTLAQNQEKTKESDGISLDSSKTNVKKPTEANMLGIGFSSKTISTDLDQLLESKEKQLKSRSSSVIESSTSVINSKVPESQNSESSKTAEKNQSTAITTVKSKSPKTVKKFKSINSPSIPKIITDSQIKIENISSTKCRAGIMFKCLAFSCTYSTLNESTFKYHLELQHPMAKWSSFCTICNKRFSESTLSLIEEFNHLRDYHSNEVITKRNDVRDDTLRSNSKDLHHSDRSQIREQNSIQNKSKVSRKLNFKTTFLSSENINENEIVTEQNETNDSQRIQTKSQPENEKVNKNLKKSPSPMSTIRVPKTNNSDKIVTLPQIPSNDDLLVQTSTKSVTTSNNSESNHNDDGIMCKSLVRVKILPGDKLSKANFENELSTSSKNENLKKNIVITKSIKIIQKQPQENSKVPPTAIVEPRIPNTEKSLVPVSSVAQFTSSALPVHQATHISATSQQKNLSTLSATVSLPTYQPKPLQTIADYNTSKLTTLTNTSDFSKEISLKCTELSVITLLRPWMVNQNNRKKPEIITAMKKSECLKDLFKCMHDTCAFHTTNNESFVSHLNSHKSSWLNNRSSLFCSYCSFQNPDIKYLVDHITLHHGKCRYYCNFCFYRASSTYNISRHMNKFHNHVKGSVIHYDSNINELDENEELSRVKTIQHRIVHPITCSACKTKFYNYKMFEEHRKKEHPDGILYRCNVCFEKATELNLYSHLSKCHKINQYHCSYCGYGSESKDEIADHLMNFHSERIPFYCERVNTSQINDPSSIETTTIYKFSINKLEDW